MRNQIENELQKPYRKMLQTTISSVLKFKSFAILMIVFLIQSPLSTYACEVCKENQPKVLRGITHGVGPQGDWDYIIISFAALVVAATFIISVKLLVNPKESDPKHIKNFILE